MMNSKLQKQQALEHRMKFYSRIHLPPGVRISRVLYEQNTMVTKCLTPEQAVTENLIYVFDQVDPDRDCLVVAILRGSGVQIELVATTTK